MTAPRATALSLPGSDTVERGIADLARGRESEEALAVATAAERLRAAGVAVPEAGIERPSHRLYAVLAQACGDDAHGRYNAVLRRVSSYARALEGTVRTQS